MPTIVGPQSGVGCMGGLGRYGRQWYSTSGADSGGGRRTRRRSGPSWTVNHRSARPARSARSATAWAGRSSCAPPRVVPERIGAGAWLHGGGLVTAQPESASAHRRGFCSSAENDEPRESDSKNVHGIATRRRSCLRRSKGMPAPRTALLASHSPGQRRSLLLARYRLLRVQDALNRASPWP